MKVPNIILRVKIFGFELISIHSLPYITLLGLDITFHPKRITTHWNTILWEKEISIMLVDRFVLVIRFLMY